MHKQSVQAIRAPLPSAQAAGLIVIALLIALFPTLAIAQQNNSPAAPQQSSASSVPHLIQFNGTLGGSAPAPSGTVSITFTLYENEQGGTALWSETQNVQVDAQGHYTALLGSTSTDGLPLNLFTTVQAHWLAVQPAGPEYTEQPRVLLVSAPYALKAGDAETIGGLPPSAFQLAAPGTSSGSTSISSSLGLASSGLPGASARKPVKPPLSGSGTTNYIPIWTSSTNLGNSNLYQTGGNVGIGTTTPGFALDVNGNINTSTVYDIAGSVVVALPRGPNQGNTALGVGALSSTTGFDNTATGTIALALDTRGSDNTATGLQALEMNTTGDGNTAIGLEALWLNTTGGGNTASGQGALGANTTASFNTAIGFDALGDNTTGAPNTASGYQALELNTTGSYNTASGNGALQSNTTGAANTASGSFALLSNTTGGFNTASGTGALISNTTASDNTAIGYDALDANTTGSPNTAIGYQALELNTTGAANTANGADALLSNTTGSRNTASGFGALQANTTGAPNTAIGYDALVANTIGSFNTASGTNALVANTTGSTNTADGDSALQANTTGSNNIAIGFLAASNVSGGNSNNIHIGSAGSSGDNDLIRIGTKGTQKKFFVAGVSGVSVASAVPVMIDSVTGQLGTVSSSRRFKEDIHDMGDASEALMRLRPVTFRYKQPFEDGSKPIQYGLIAEEVAEVYPDMVARSADGQIETVKYQLLDPMLLNEVQRQQKEMARQQDEIRDQKALLLAQQNQLKFQQAQMRELASQVEMIQASLHHRRGSGTVKLASAKNTPAPATTDANLLVASSVHGGN